MINAQQVPNGMVIVTKDEFYAALYAEKRDIMPTVEDKFQTPWRIMSNRAMWGWCSVGYASGFGAEKVYALVA